jgi:hypothetical protein
MKSWPVDGSLEPKHVPNYVIIIEGCEDLSCRVLHEGQLSDSINDYLCVVVRGPGVA